MKKMMRKFLVIAFAVLPMLSHAGIGCGSGYVTGISTNQGDSDKTMFRIMNIDGTASTQKNLTINWNSSNTSQNNQVKVSQLLTNLRTAFVAGIPVGLWGGSTCTDIKEVWLCYDTSNNFANCAPW